VRSLIVVASLAALFAISNSTSGNAASSNQRTNVSYSSASSSNSSQISRAAEQPVPPNCVRQECGKLWCWQMGHK
jgi:hypothetical protein